MTERPPLRPAPKAAWAGAPWAAGVLVAFAASVVHSALNADQVLHGLSDEALLVPLGLRTVGAAPYAGDTWLATAAGVFSIPYSWLVGLATRSAEDPVLALRLMAAPFLAVFLAGVWKLAARVGGSAAAARLALALTVAPVLLAEPALAAHLGVFAPALHGSLAEMTLAPGAALPRDLVFAFFPLLWAAGSGLFDRGGLVMALAGLVAGLLANVHPLTALHTAGLLLLTGLWERHDAGGFARFGAAVLGFLLGAAPFLAQYLSYPSLPGSPAPELLRWRIDGIGGESLQHWADRVEPLIWLWLGMLVLLRAAGTERTQGETRLLRGAVVATVVAAAGPLVTNSVPALQGLQPDRFGRFAAVLMVVLGARLALLAWRGQAGRLVATGAVALLCVAFVGPAAVRVVRGGGDRGPFGTVVRKLVRDTGAAAARPSLPPGLVARTTPGDPSSPRDPAATADFLDVCRFARTDAPDDALFLVPPEEFGAFRVYARRGVVVTRKEGGFALSFLGGRGTEWFEQYARVVRTYAGGTDDDWASLAGDSGAGFAVLDPTASPPPGWVEVHRNGTYRVVRTGP